VPTGTGGSRQRRHLPPETRAPHTRCSRLSQGASAFPATHTDHAHESEDSPWFRSLHRTHTRRQAGRLPPGAALQRSTRADRALYTHSLVWALTQHLVTSLEYSEEERATITRAALVHDVGKLTLPRTLLDTPSRLSPQEYALMQQHCATGAHLLRQRGVDEAMTPPSLSKRTVPASCLAGTRALC
jgi:putative nucleotidyltransferase with HDIG domain